MIFKSNYMDQSHNYNKVKKIVGWPIKWWHMTEIEWSWVAGNDHRPSKLEGIIKNKMIIVITVKF